MCQCMKYIELAISSQPLRTPLIRSVLICTSNCIRQAADGQFGVTFLALPNNAIRKPDTSQHIFCPIICEKTPVARTITYESLPLLTQWVRHEAFCASRAPRRGNAAQALAPRSRLLPRPCVRASQANGGSRLRRCRDRQPPEPS